MLIAAITIMTVILTIVGVQLIFILKDARILLQRINSIVEEFEKIGLSMGQGYSEILHFVSGFKKVFYFMDLLSKKRKHKKNE